MTQPVDINSIKAGRYELLDLRWDEPTSGPQDPVFTFVRHYQGEILELDEAQAKRLVLAGSVAEEGELQRRRVAALRAQYEQALANLPDDLRRAEQVRALSLADVAEGEIPTEELTVHTAEGFTPTDSPRYSNAAHGEGDGGPDPQGEGDDGVVDDGLTQALLDDGTGNGVTAAVREGRAGRVRAGGASEEQREEVVQTEQQKAADDEGAKTTPVVKKASEK